MSHCRDCDSLFDTCLIDILIQPLPAGNQLHRFLFGNSARKKQLGDIFRHVDSPKKKNCVLNPLTSYYGFCVVESFLEKKQFLGYFAGMQNYNTM
jgi:hypothetical protein